MLRVKIKANTNKTDTFYQLPNKFTVCDIYIAEVTAFVQQYTSIDVSSAKEYSGSNLTQHVIKYIDYTLLQIIKLAYKIILCNLRTLKNNVTTKFRLKVSFFNKF